MTENRYQKWKLIQKWNKLMLVLLWSTLTIYSAVNGTIKKAVLLLASNIEGMDTCSAVQCRMKSLSSKTRINFPSVVKIYNKGMGGVGPMDLKTAACQLVWRSKCRFLSSIFFWFNGCGSWVESYSLSTYKWKP